MEVLAKEWYIPKRVHTYRGGSRSDYTSQNPLAQQTHQWTRESSQRRFLWRELSYESHS